MNQLVANLHKIQNGLAADVTLVAVSKTKPAEAIKTLFDAGQIDFGENRVQELVEKYEILPKGIRWHLIGHLQKNKVKYIAPFVHLIHSIDGEELLSEVNKYAAKNGRILNCLLQIKIADEQTKFGLEQGEAQQIMRTYAAKFPFVKIVGLMGMATFTDDENQIRNEFKRLKTLFDQFKMEIDQHTSEFTILSMGMSSDYQIAIEEGSTMVRVGSSIFGDR